MLNNFTYDKFSIKIKSSCPKLRLSGQISKTEQNDVTNDVIDQKRDMLSKSKSCQNLSLVMVNNLPPIRYFVKIKLSCSKRRSSGKISEIEQNDVNK